MLNYLGYAWTEQGRNLDRAPQMIERAVELRPNEGSFMDSLGWVLLQQGDEAGALKNLERAVELQPEDATVNGHLGDALAAVGRWREAEFQWRRALILKPEPQEQQRMQRAAAPCPPARARPDPRGRVGACADAEPAPAKVNLFLHVTGRRADGYHLLDSLAVFPGRGDVLQAAPADGCRWRSTGRSAPGWTPEPDNLVLRAARALAAAGGRPGRPWCWRSTCRSPAASAAARRMRRRRCGCCPACGRGVPPDALAALAPGWGRTCRSASPPARRAWAGSGRCWARRRPCRPAGCCWSTPAWPCPRRTCSARAPARSAAAALPPRWPDAAAMAADLAPLGNDLEAPALALCPAIGDVLAWLRARPGCLLARMSGSGATCFGLFADAAAAAAAAAGQRAGRLVGAGPAPLRTGAGAALLEAHGWGVAKR